jgi:uncharacterized OsmC-like protein
MHTIEVTYEGELRTRALHKPSGTEIVTDAPVDNKGRGASFSPTDLASTSLASCMMTIMGILADSHGFVIDGTLAEVTKVMASDPRRIAEIHVKMIFPEGITYDEKQKIMIKRAAHTCPVALSLGEQVVQNISFVFNGIEEK